MASSLKIIDIEDSGNNGIIYKVLDFGRSRAFKLMYGFSIPEESLVIKAEMEFSRSNRLSGIEGIPKTYRFYDSLDEFGNYDSFDCEGFDLHASKKQIMNNRIAYEVDSENDLILAGGFTMTYMDIFSKLPKESKDIPYKLPKRFFEKLEYISEEMFKKGLSLPPEFDFCFDKNLEPIVLDFGQCIDKYNLVRSTSSNIADIYIKRHNSSVINFLKTNYQK